VRIARKDGIKKPRVISTGEIIYEMIGVRKNLGGTRKHTFSYVVIPPNCSSRPDFHAEEEETYYILKGRGKLVIDGKNYLVHPGDAVLISPPERHQIFAIGKKALEFVVVDAPPLPPNPAYV